MRPYGTETVSAHNRCLYFFFDHEYRRSKKSRARRSPYGDIWKRRGRIATKELCRKIAAECAWRGEVAE